MQPKDSLYKLNTESSHLETLTFKEPDDTLNSVGDYLTSRESLQPPLHPDKVSLRKVPTKQKRPLKLTLRAKFEAFRNSLPIVWYYAKRFMFRALCMLMVVGFLLMTLVSAFR